MNRPAFSLPILAFLAIACPLASAETTALPQDEGTRQFLEMVNRPVVLQPGEAKRVQVRENLTYRADVPGARADVYLPTGSSRRPAPIVVLVHGGMGPEFPVRPKDWGLYRSWGRLLASEGFVTVAFNHRLGFPAPMIEEAAGDLDSLTAFVRRSAGEWRADPERIAILPTRQAACSSRRHCASPGAGSSRSWPSIRSSTSRWPNT